MNGIVKIGSLNKIVDLLILMRIKDMHKRHERLFFENISRIAYRSDDIDDSGAAEYLPSRRKWLRPGRLDRVGKNHDELIRRCIRKTIKCHIFNNTLDKTDWGMRLLALQDDVKGVLEHPESYCFTPPNIITVKKPGKSSYRVMAACSNIKDRIISGILARYFADMIEPLLSNSCYSFRANGKTYHDAVLDLHNYRNHYLSKKFYVSECDLRGFYDCLSHDVAISAVNSMAQERGVTIDSSAMILLRALFKSYSFPNYAFPEACRILASKNAKGAVEWLALKERAEIYGEIPGEKIGVAQGSPISPVLANAVLNYADRNVISVLGSEGYYARYCDDIIILHPHKTVCALGMQAYLDTINKLHLPVHPLARPLVKYGPDHYSQKSRAPFLWGDHKNIKSAMPWINFVGYQIHFQGHIRIRKQSVQNQKAAINELVAKTLALVEKSNLDDLRVDGYSVYHRVAMRLIRAAIGDKRSQNDQGPISEPCWVDAFPLIDKNVYTAVQMRELDRHITIVMRKLKYKLVEKGLLPQENSEISLEKNNQPNRYYGAPYSYYGAIGDSGQRCCRTRIGYEL